FGARDRLRSRFPTVDERRRAIGALLVAGGPLDPLVEHADPAARIDAAEDRRARREQIMLASGDPDALTLRAARLLGLADHVYHDRQVPDVILDRARADAARVIGDPPATPVPGLTVHLVWKPQ